MYHPALCCPLDVVNFSSYRPLGNTANTLDFRSWVFGTRRPCHYTPSSRLHHRAKTCWPTRLRQGSLSARTWMRHTAFALFGDMLGV
jgi:hypothetical protein